MRSAGLAVALLVLWADPLRAGTRACARPEEPDLAVEPCLTSFGGYFDQDWLFSAKRYNQDRNYTMGLAFSLTGSLAQLFPLKRVDELSRVQKLHRWAGGSLPPHRSHALFVGHGAFTPADLDEAQAIRGDRPYASVLYLSFVRATFNPEVDLIFRSEVTLGVLGLGIARNLQTRIHRNLREGGGLRPYDPLGWDNQVSSGGEPTLKYAIGLQYGLPHRAWFKSRWHDLAVLAEANLGYYTDAAAGLLVRAGRIRSHFSALATNPVGAGNRLVQPVARSGGRGRASERQGPGRPYRSRTDLELYAYATGRARGVLYNALLQGQLRHSEVRLSWSEVEHGILEFETGVSAGGWGFSATLALIAGRTAEYRVAGAEGRTAGRSHVWGGLYLSYRLPGEDGT